MDRLVCDLIWIVIWLMPLLGSICCLVVSVVVFVQGRLSARRNLIVLLVVGCSRLWLNVFVEGLAILDQVLCCLFV